MADNAWRLHPPCADGLTVLGADMIAHAMNRPEMMPNGRRHLCPNGAAFRPTRTGGTVPQDGSRAGSKGRPYMQRPAALLCLCLAARHVPWWRGPRRSATRPRRQGGVRSHGQDALIRRHGTRVAGEACSERGRNGRGPWSLGREPALRAPGLEVRAGQHPPHGGGGEPRHDPCRAALVGQCRAIPRGPTAAQRLRARAGQPHEVDRDRRGGKHPGHRGQGRPRGHPAAGRETAWPTGGRRLVAHQRA
jgi:hypothetical protein